MAVGVASQIEAGLAQATTQGMQSIQQFAGMAAQAARHSAGPVLADSVHDDDHADGDKTAAAAEGTPGAGRAPVDTGEPAASEAQPERLV